MEFLKAYFAMYSFLWIFTGILNVASYVLISLALYTIAQRRGVPKAWTAWVPVASGWLMGALSDQYQGYACNKKTKRAKLLLWLYIGAYGALFLMVPAVVLIVVGAINELAGLLALGMLLVFVLYFAAIGLAIAGSVFYYISLYDIFRSCEPQNATVFLVLSICVGIATPVLLFICREKDGGMVPWQPPRYQPPQYLPAWQQPQYQQPPYQQPPYQQPPYQQPPQQPSRPTQDQP